MSLAQRIHLKLERAFAPSHITVEDDSARHAGHAGARPGGETHFSILVVADVFDGRSRLERHRAIHSVLTEEFADRLHALAIRALTSSEHQGILQQSSAGRNRIP